MNRLEDSIRDYLAEHLDLLEGGLALVQKEYVLPNPEGAGGRIDIVAKDRFGHFVVIEIKRSNQAARQALHEVHKYSALFRLNLGLDERKVRLMLVSTEWHELQIALSEFAAVTPYSVEGFVITASSDGQVSECSKVELNAVKLPGGELKISRCQAMYLFRSSSGRDKLLHALPDQIVEVGLKDYALLLCNYNGVSDRVVYPYAVYLCFVSPLEDDNPDYLEEVKSSIEWEDLDNPDENFLCALERRRLVRVDELEFCYPEKLATAEQLGWTITVAMRRGRLDQASSIISDEELVRMAQATSGGSEFYFGGTSSARFNASWRTFCSQITPVLEGYDDWLKLLPSVLSEIESTEPNAIVSVYAYGPADLLVSLYAVAVANDYSLCPHFELIVENTEAEELRALSGVLVWDTDGVEEPLKLFSEVFGDIFEWRVATQMGAAAEQERRGLRGLNLRCVVAEWKFSNGDESGPFELVVSERSIERRPTSEWNYKSIREFARENRDQLEELRKAVDEVSTGLRESIFNLKG